MNVFYGYLDDEEIMPRTEGDSLDITNDVSQSPDELVGLVVGELGRDIERQSRDRVYRPEQPLSPGGEGLIRMGCPPKRKSQEQTGKKGRKEKRTRDQDEVEIVGLEPTGSRNSDDFPENERPDMFKDDNKFNKLRYETAAKICWVHKRLSEKKDMKAKKSASLKKADDKLPHIKLSADEDDAKTIFSEARRKLRPPVVELKK